MLDTSSRYGYHGRMNTTTTGDKPMERFWKKVQKTDVCWLWMGHRLARGYGTISMGGRKGRPELAHRVAYVLTYGPIPDGLQVLHRCDNPPCVRPDHLFLGSQAENLADMRQKGRWRRASPKTHRAKGNRLSEQHRAAISEGMRRRKNRGT